MSYRINQPSFSFESRRHRNSSRVGDTTLGVSPTTVLAYVALSLALIYYSLFHMRFIRLSPLEILWHVLVYIMPSRVLYALDEWLSASGSPWPDEEAKPTSHAAKSEALRRVIGLDGGGILAKLSLTRKGTKFNKVLKGGRGDVPPGLGNWDNSCFQNSVIQALASLPSMANYLSVTLSNPSLNWESPNIRSRKMEALLNMIGKLNDPANKGRRFWIPSELKSINSWQQQDAQEYLSKILDELDKEVSQAIRGTNMDRGLQELPVVTVKSGPLSRNHQLQNPVEGLVAQRVGCLRCGFSEGLSLIPFNCITVPLGRDWIYDLRDCLDEYTSLENIEGVECGNCTLLKSKANLEQLLAPNLASQTVRSLGDASNLAESPPALAENIRIAALARLEAVTTALEDGDMSEKVLKNVCKIAPRNRVSTTKTRQAVVARAPKCLIVHVNRSVFDEFSGVQRKNYAQVNFQQTLDLGYWCLGRTDVEGENEDIVETWNMEPGESMRPGSGLYGESERGPLYGLRAVVTHYGRHENGHYICYRKLPAAPIPAKVKSDVEENKETERLLPGIESWWRISDDDVVPVSEQQVLEQPGAFMLFYEMIKEGDPDYRRKLGPGALAIEQCFSNGELPHAADEELTGSEVTIQSLRSPNDMPTRTVYDGDAAKIGYVQSDDETVSDDSSSFFASGSNSPKESGATSDTEDDLYSLKTPTLLKSLSNAELQLEPATAAELRVGKSASPLTLPDLEVAQTVAEMMKSVGLAEPEGVQVGESGSMDNEGESETKLIAELGA